MKNKLIGNKLSDVKLSYLRQYLSGENILDIGAGYGYYSSWMAKKNAACKVTALDYLDYKTDGSFTYTKCNLEQVVPLPSETFDSIVAFDIIEHIADEKNIINEIYRLCRPGGTLIGSVPHDNDKFLPAYNLTFYHRSDITHKRYYTPETITQTLTTAGFSIKTIDLRGGVSPHVIAEFFPSHMKFIVKKTVGMLRRIGLINTKKLSSDLFFIAYKT